jgi:hypothetical protein
MLQRARAGRSCWKLINGMGGIEEPANERARPGARLQARSAAAARVRPTEHARSSTAHAR